MPRPTSKRLVIDASIGRAAGGEDATHPTSKQCRDFLSAVLSICHQLVVSPNILNEWKKHRSRFAKTWLASMTARKKVYRVTEEGDESLREEARTRAETEKQAAAMLKDCHLLEAALAADGVVIALDEVVRQLFDVLAQHVGPLRRVIWGNPSKEEELLIEWLRSGARAQKRRCLGWSEEDF